MRVNVRVPIVSKRGGSARMIEMSLAEDNGVQRSAEIYIRPFSDDGIRERRRNVDQCPGTVCARYTKCVGESNGQPMTFARNSV